MISKILNNHILILAFFFIPCVTPAALLGDNVVGIAFNIWRVFGFLGILLYMWKTKQKLTKTIIYCGVFSVLICLMTAIRGSSFNSSVSIAMMMMTIVILSEIEISRDIKCYFKVISCISFIILVVDTFQIYTGIGFDASSNSSWLGGDNFAIFSVLPMIGIILLNDYINKQRISKYTLAFLIIVMLAKLKTFAVTSMLACLTVVFSWFILTYIKLSKRSKIVLLSVALVGIMITIIFFTDIYMFVASLFGKESIIEHSRLQIWRLSLEAIMEYPIFGHGVLTAYDETVAIAGMYWPSASHTHNYILEILFRTGIIGTICYFAMFKDYIKTIIIGSDNRLIILLKSFLIGCLVLWVTDSYYGQAPVYVLVVLCSHIDRLKDVKLIVKKKIKL